MSNDIYSYIKENFGIEITDYQFKRDYIKEPLKKIPINTPTGYTYENPFKEDLEYLYISLNLSVIDLMKLFNQVKTTINRILSKFNIKKPSNLRIKNMIKTNIKKYGCENVFQNQQIKEKIKEKCFKKYGVYYYNQTKENQNKIAKTNLIKYGNKCSLHGSSQKKIENIFFSKYGVQNPKQNNLIKRKDYETKKKNHTFGKSKQEDKIYELLIQKYPNTIRQYYSEEKYPFPCDFYIPELDLYIEYQGYFSHGKEPYIRTNEQKEIVKLWESKNTAHYKNAIHTWTISDPLKRKTAKDNGLNWIEFFTMEEFMNWYNLLI